MSVSRVMEQSEKKASSSIQLLNQEWWRLKSKGDFLWPRRFLKGWNLTFFSYWMAWTCVLTGCRNCRPGQPFGASHQSSCSSAFSIRGHLGALTQSGDALRHVGLLHASDSHGNSHGSHDSHGNYHDSRDRQRLGGGNQLSMPGSFTANTSLFC